MAQAHILRLPPGQFVTDRFPVLHAGTVPLIRKEDWTFKVHGEVEKPIVLTYEEFSRLPRTRVTCDIHCVTTWSKFGTIWEGVSFLDLAKIVRPTSKANFAIFECEQGFTTNVPCSALLDEDVLVADRYDGKEIEPVHGGPVRMLVPRRYFYKSAKWLKAIKLTEEDELGFWEVRGYSNSADPWAEDRYAQMSWADIFKMRRSVMGRKVV